MLKPWKPFEPDEFEPVRLHALDEQTQVYYQGSSIEFAALGFLHAGDYRLHREWKVQSVRFFRSADGTMLGWASVKSGRREVSLTSILSDGTLVQSCPCAPVAPWNCCRFPVHVNFASGAALDELLVRHVTALAELEHGCGPVLRYAIGQLEEIVRYIQQLVHETLHGLGAPESQLDLPQSRLGGVSLSSDRLTWNVF